MLKLCLDATALEKLLGGDSEVELELRKQVIATFAGRYLKPLAETPVMRDILKNLEKQTIEEIKQTIGHEADTWGDRFVLHDLIKDKIKYYVRHSIIQITKEVVSNMDSEIEDLIKAEVKRSVVASVLKQMETHYKTILTLTEPEGGDKHV